MKSRIAAPCRVDFAAPDACSGRRRAWTAPLVALAVSVFLAVPACGEEASFALADLEITFDAERWRAQTLGDEAVILEPVGTAARDHDPVHVLHMPGGDMADCERLAALELPEMMYEPPASVPATVAGLAAARFQANTRCRNAMPKGIVVCVPYRGTSYALVATRQSCRSGARALFTGTDPLAELLAGLRFAQ